MSRPRRHDLGTLTEKDAEAILRAASSDSTAAFDTTAATDALLEEVFRRRPFGVQRNEATGLYTAAEAPSDSWSPRAAVCPARAAPPYD